MAQTKTTQLADAVSQAAHQLRGEAIDFDPLMKQIGDARLVLIGEASHGTHEFYRERAEITKRLIQEKGFTAVTKLRQPRLERAIGVIYRPQTERVSHYFQAQLPDQFDAVLHFDETRAVEPLERTPQWETGQTPETFPSGI